MEVLFENRIAVRSETSSESFQMATYGIGGDIGLHFDTYGKPDNPEENFLDFESGEYFVLP